VGKPTDWGIGLQYGVSLPAQCPGAISLSLSLSLSLMSMPWRSRCSLPARKAPHGGRGGRASGRLVPEDRSGLDAKFGRHPLAHLVVVAQHVLRSRPTCDFLTQRLPVHACFKWPVPHPRAQIAVHVWGIVWTVFAGARVHKNPGSREIIRSLWRLAFLPCSRHCSQDLKRPRHTTAGQNACQWPQVALPARAVRCTPRLRLRAAGAGGRAQGSRARTAVSGSEAHPQTCSPSAGPSRLTQSTSTLSPLRTPAGRGGSPRGDGRDAGGQRDCRPNWWQQRVGAAVVGFFTVKSGGAQ